MTTWSEIFNSTIDPESPLVSELFFKLRDNSIATMEGDPSALGAVITPPVGVYVEKSPDGIAPVQTALITDAVDTTLAIMVDGTGSFLLAQPIFNASIGQAQLKTADGTVSVGTNTNANLILPGGAFGFEPQIRVASTGVGADSMAAQKAENWKVSTSFTTSIWLDSDATGGGGVNTAYARQEYVTASPPYDLGDGEIPLFVFGLMRGGKIVAMYVAPEPPWAYNGPTNIRGIPYGPQQILSRPKVKRQHTLADVRNGDISMEEFRKSPVTVEYIPLDTEFKNSDIDIVPHPFANSEAGDEIILFNGMECEKLAEMHAMGEAVDDLIYDGYLELDNSKFNAKAPKGVRHTRFKWRNSKQKKLR